MCIIAWNWQPDADTPLIVVANRDEFYDRPSLPMHWWSEPSILAGKDMHGSGTWLATNQYGYFAALTNYRNIQLQNSSLKSRGEIIVDYFKKNKSASDYIDDLNLSNSLYNYYNIILYDGAFLYGYESHTNNKFAFSPGINVVSNGSLFCKWHKSLLLKNLFNSIISSESFTKDNLLKILQNNCQSNIINLPNTGISSEIELLLSSIFINSDNYGTRMSTIFIKNKSYSMIYEIVYDKDGITSQSHHKILLQRESGNSIFTSKTSRLS